MESDYAQFFQPKVPEALRRAAVKKLFADPHFNIMDGLDTYIDDYSKPDPLPPEMLARLWHARDIIDHPSNRKAEVVETEALAAATPDAQAPAKPAVAEEMVFTDPACRPREGGDPATFDAGERSDPAKPDESHWVPACAGTTGLLTLPGTTDLLTLPGTTDLLTLSGTTDSHDCAGTMDSPGCDGTTDAPVPTASDKPPGTTA